MRQFCSTRFPGFLVALIIAITAMQLGSLAPIIGAPVFAILIGIIFRLCVGLHENMQSGVSFSAKKVLQFGIILLGAGLNLQTLFTVGKQSFAVMIGSLAVALIGGYAIGALLGLPLRLVSLISVGTGICGASAITSLSPIIDAKESEIAYSISTIFFFNVIAVFLFPFFGHAFAFSDHAFGLWAGTAINDTSSVVAAGYAYSAAAGAYATVVKLTRSLMIIPVCLMFLLIKSIVSRQKARRNNSVKLPLFIIGFVGMSAFSTIGWFGESGGQAVSYAGQFFIVIALAAVGLSADLRGLMRTGWRPILLGLIVWVLVACSSLLLQQLTGNL
ncbi:MAG TPA: putative sulfate exporter family transporter [Bacilli bacterium]